MASGEHKPGFELVFTVMDYYDGPLTGIADFNGCPHFYDRIFSESLDEYSDLYRLTPITKQIMDLAKEDWAIWKRWELAFHAGKTTIASHPALPQDRTRHDEIETILKSALKTDSNTCTIRAGSFEVIGNPILPKGIIRPLQVKWKEPELEKLG